MITVEAVIDRAGWSAFKQVHRVVHPGAPAWLRDESVSFRDLLLRGGDGGRARAFVAYEGATAVGRIVALEEPSLRGSAAEGVGYFGFYEAVDRQAVASALLDAAAQWVRARSLTRLRGPVNPSISHSAGLLTNGFEHPALVGMPYNPAYYCDQVADWGLRKAKDLHSYILTEDLAGVVARTRPTQKLMREATQVTFRSLDPSRFDQEVETVRELYNTSFVDFWGFTPMTRDEFLKLATDYRPLLDADLVVFAEQGGQTVGFVMAIPDVNQALARASRWSSGPACALATLWHWKGPGRRRTMQQVRVDMLMVDPQVGGRGIARELLYEVIARINDKGYTSVEAGPVLEGSSWLDSVVANVRIELSRTHRVYECELAGTTAHESNCPEQAHEVRSSGITGLSKSKV